MYIILIQSGVALIEELEIATVTSRGQITLPALVRKKLGVQKGSKVVFVELDGRYIVENVNMLQLKDRSLDFSTEEFLAFSETQIAKLNEDDEW